MLTGMNAVRNGVTDNLHTLRQDYRECGINTWPEILDAAGYHTAAVGKMHFYPWDRLHGFRYRVACEDKQWALIMDDYHHYLKDHGLEKLGWSEYGDYLERKGVAHTDVPWEHSWDRYTGRAARRFIDTHGREGPFALMVGFPGPHDPYDPAADFPHTYRADEMPDPIPSSPSHERTLRDARTRIRTGMGMDLETWTCDEMKDARAHYAGLVKQIDHEVGEILDTLRRNQLLDSTVIVFSTDHGDHIGDHGIDGKATFYEASAHIPMLVRTPGRGEGATRSELVELRDVTATMLSVAGWDIPGYMDARPLPGLGLDGASPRNHIFGMLSSAWMAFDGRYKLSKYSSGESMLFDLRTDPNEQLNLIADPELTEVYRRLDMALTDELMHSMSLSMHDRMPRPYSMSEDVDMGREGWTWSFPAPSTPPTTRRSICDRPQYPETGPGGRSPTLSSALREPLPPRPPGAGAQLGGSARSASRSSLRRGWGSLPSR